MHKQSNIVGFSNILICDITILSTLFMVAVLFMEQYSTPFSESPGVNPVSLYAATKKSNEVMAHAYTYLYGIPATGLRFTVYGPWGRPDMALFYLQGR